MGVLTIFGRGKELFSMHWKVTAVSEKEKSSKNEPGTGPESKGMESTKMNIGFIERTENGGECI